MKLVVVIATTGRPEVLYETLRHLEEQRRKPDAVFISAATESDVPDLGKLTVRPQVLLGPRGLAAQRNTALNVVLGSSDIITFFDDDFVPADDYLEQVEVAFSKHSDYAVVHGRVVADGITGAGLTFEQGRDALALDQPDLSHEVVEDISAYGCNMSFRANLIGTNRFDERLVLYGWQEDRDFSARMLQYGRVVRLGRIRGVHLGVKGGRVSGLRFGYSQVANPVYLVRKGTMSPRAAASLVLRNLTANTLKCFHPEPWVDRRGRLRGNLLALSHVAGGRIEPEHVLKL
jgi:hypothetical protein